jgi:hypothetical protein
LIVKVVVVRVFVDRLHQIFEGVRLRFVGGCVVGVVVGMVSVVLVVGIDVGALVD